MSYNEFLIHIVLKIEEYESRIGIKPLGILMNETTKEYLIKSFKKDCVGVEKVETFMGLKVLVSNDLKVGEVNLVI